MPKILDQIRNQRVPTSSTIAAATHLGSNGIGTLADSEYIERIEELAGTTVSFEDSHMYRLTYAYLVTNAIQAFKTTDNIDGGQMLALAKDQAAALIKSSPWMFVVDSDPELDDNGKAKPKKGEKKRMAMAVYKELIEGKDLKRKEAIQILVDKVEMTPAGASTYYANLKKHNGVL